MNINSLELRQLRYFVAVAEELHFGRAAKRLNISQPPLSQQIMAMEEHLGAPLFTRTNRRVALTESGKYLLRAAKNLLRDAKHITEHTRMVAQGVIGKVSVGVHLSAPLYPFVGHLLQQFRLTHPQIKLELVMHERPDLQQLVDIDSAALDVALVWIGRIHQSVDLRRFDLAYSPMRVFLPTGHPLTAKKRIHIRDLATEPMIAPLRTSGSQLYEVLIQQFSAAGYEPNLIYEGVSMPLMLSMVTAGQGVALLPSFLERLNVPGVVARPLDRITRAPAGVTLNLVARRQQTDGADELFIQHAVAFAAQYNDGDNSDEQSAD